MLVSFAVGYFQYTHLGIPAQYKKEDDLHMKMQIIFNFYDLYYSASSQLCHTFWTSSLSSNISSIFCIFLISSSFVSLM